MRSVAVIGMSSFGFNLCKFLADAGVEVLAIDRLQEKIDDIKSFVAKAIVADAREKETLEELSLTEFDTLVICIGEPIDTSILITLYLNELEVKEIFAKASSEDHAKILKKIGASHIIFPEKDMAERVAHILRRSNLFDYYSLGDDHSVIEIAAPEKWQGKSLSALDLQSEYHVQVVMIKEESPEFTLMIPDSSYVITENDILVILGRNEDLDKIEGL